jgi:hypothetical protein
MRRLSVWMGLAALGLAPLLAAPADARTVEVHLMVRSDLQRLHPNAPPDEPLEPTPTIAEKAREVIGAHPAFRQVTVRLEKSETAPNPRVPADFLRLVDSGVDDMVEVSLNYHLRLDSFHANGKAGVQGYVAVYSVPGRRKVLSRAFTLVVSYPGEVTKAAVIQAELAARAKGAAVPIEEVELGLLNAAVKERLGAALGAALGAYYPASLPSLSTEAVRESLRRMALFLANAPDRRDDAILALENYLQRYPDSPNRGQLEQRLGRLKQAAGRGPGPKAQAQSDWASMGISKAVTAKELAEAFERLVGSKLELWSFKLDWRDGTVVMTPTDKNQDFIVEGTPPAMRELEADPNPIYILVVGRREDPRIPLVDVKVPVVRFLGCPKTSCPPTQ